MKYVSNKQFRPPNKALFILFGVLLGIGGITGALMLQNKPSEALSGANWRAGKIISDAIFYNSKDMTAAQVQAFLNKKVPSCDTNGTGTSEYGGGTRAQYGTSVGYPPPYVCLKNYYEHPSSKANNLSGKPIPSGALSAAQIIKHAADQYGISVRVLLTTLQKESPGPLITDTWPFAKQYRNAMGYGCPDTAPCDPAYAGFYNQMHNAARQFKNYKDNPQSYRYKPFQNNSILWNPNASCGAGTVNIQTRATAGLYNYTPYQPNQAALNNLYGTGNGCSAYGNRNFWTTFHNWWGSTAGQSSPFFKTGDGKIYMQGEGSTYYYVQSPDMMAAYGYGRFFTTVESVGSSYLNGQTYKGTLSQAARFGGDEVYFMSFGRRHHVPNRDILEAYGYTTSEASSITDSAASYLPQPAQKVQTTFIKMGGPSVFHAENGKKHHIGTPEAHNTLGSPVVYSNRARSDFSDYFVNTMPSGAPILTEGTTIYNTTTGNYGVYESGVLRYATSAQIGKDWKLPVMYPAASTLNNFSTGSTIGRYVTAPGGAKYLVDSGNKVVANTASNQHLRLSTGSYTAVSSAFLNRLPTANFEGTVHEIDKTITYEVKNGELFHIPTRGDFEALGYQWGKIVPLSAGFLSTLTNNQNKVFGEGGLLRINDSTQVYMIDGGNKRHITSRHMLESYGRTMNDVTVVNTATGNRYPSGSQLSTLVNDNSGQLWLIDSGKRFKIPDQLKGAAGYNLNESNATTVSSANFAKLASSDLTNLFSDATTNKTYRLEHGKKRWFTDRASFERNGGNWSKVRVLSSQFVNTIPNGPHM